MNLTDNVVIGAIVILSLYEAWTLANDRKNDEISRSVWRASYKRPLVPFSAGMLCGHFFWQSEDCAEAIQVAIARAVEWVVWLGQNV